MSNRPTPIVLTAPDAQELTKLISRHQTPQQVVMRARIILRAEQGKNNTQIAREMQINVDTVRLWRERWVELDGMDRKTMRVRERLEDAPRPGAPPQITTEQRCQIIALACEAPACSKRPISQWTGREIADEVKKRGICAAISPRHAARLLKKGGCNRIDSAIG